MPRNEAVEDIQIAIDDDAEILPPTPYTFEDPVLYYLSLIHILCPEYVMYFPPDSQ